MNILQFVRIGLATKKAGILTALPHNVNSGAIAGDSIVKTCGTCRIKKAKENFHVDKTHSDGLCSSCKICRNKYAKEYKANNPNYKDWKKSNPERVKVHNHTYYTKNKEKLYKRSLQWKENHPERTRIHYKRHTAKFLSIPSNRLNQCVGSAMRKCLGGLKNHRSWQSLVGYNLKELKTHLEKQFTKGMSWDNYGKWHIDHIIPKSFFQFTTTNDVEFKMCWVLENLRPLWAKDNFSKGSKIMQRVPR